MHEFESLVEISAKEFPADDKLLRADYAQWLYLENPHGIAKIVSAAENGRWVAFLAMIPAALIVKGVRRSGYFVVNVLVDPAQRGKNIFGHLIEIAQDQVKSEGALLLGHPNTAAVGAWRRAGMRFHPPLRARLLSPIRLLSGEFDRAESSGTAGLRNFIERYNEEALETSRIAPILSEEYMRWRFIRHPSNRYRMLVISKAGTVLGVMIVKNIRWGVNLLLDCFALQGQRDVALSFAPWFTFALAAPALANASSRLWPAPIKKEFPFFCTDSARSVEADEVECLGLSLSDF